MTDTRPAGDDHPFVAVQALAQDQNLHMLEIVIAQDGALVRLYTMRPDLVFRLEGDPGSAMDRQRFDYHKPLSIPRGTPEEMLARIRAHIVEHGLT